MENKSPLLHKFSESKKNSSFLVVLLIIVVVIAGIGTGYALAGRGGGATNSPKVTKNSADIEASEIKKGDVFGSEDTKTFKDSTEGTLATGGIEGEGQFHLIRPGGISQYVYLVSSIVDLSKFEKRKIKVWGQTQKAEKAGWLMDVGKVEVIE